MIRTRRACDDLRWCPARTSRQSAWAMTVMLPARRKPGSGRLGLRHCTRIEPSQRKPSDQRSDSELTCANGIDWQSWRLLLPAGETFWADRAVIAASLRTMGDDGFHDSAAG